MTKMNLSVMMSPNILKHPSDNPMIMIQNTETERKFVEYLMDGVRNGNNKVSSSTDFAALNVDSSVRPLVPPGAV